MGVIFNIAAIKTRTRAEGPFLRLCIWFQGCSIQCRGCCNPRFQSFSPASILTLEQLMGIILETRKNQGIEGVTLTGGEPTDQAALPALIKEVREAGLGIILFTGRSVDELDEELVKGCDLILAGPYLEEQKDTDRFLIGSKNKGIVDVSGRYTGCLSYFYETPVWAEIDIGDNIFMNGD